MSQTPPKQTPPKTPPQHTDKIKSAGKKTRSIAKTGLSAMTKTFLGLLVIISIGLTIFIVNAWQQLKQANLADGQFSSAASIEVLTPSGSAPTRNPDGSIFVQQETSDDIAASAASSEDTSPANNVVIKPVRPARQTAAPATEPAPDSETPVLPTNVPNNVNNNNNDNQSPPPAQHKPKNGLDDLF